MDAKVILWFEFNYSQGRKLFLQKTPMISTTLTSIDSLLWWRISAVIGWISCLLRGWRHQGTASFPESSIVKMWIHSSVVHSVIGSTVKQHTRSAAAATRASCGAVSGPRWAATADKTPRGAYSWGALVRGSGWFLCALSVLKEKQYITNKIVQSQRVNLI